MPPLNEELYKAMPTEQLTGGTTPALKTLAGALGAMGPSS